MGFGGNRGAVEPVRALARADDVETVRSERQGFGSRSRVVDDEIRVQVELSRLAEQEIGDIDRRQMAAIPREAQAEQPVPRSRMRCPGSPLQSLEAAIALVEIAAR